MSFSFFGHFAVRGVPSWFPPLGSASLWITSISGRDDTPAWVLVRADRRFFFPLIILVANFVSLKWAVAVTSAVMNAHSPLPAPLIQHLVYAGEQGAA